MAMLMQSFGLDVRHERMGSHGTSSWVCAPPGVHLVPYGCSRNSKRGLIHFNHLIHVVRHPLKVIASAGYTQFGHGTHRNRIINFMSKFILLHKKEKPIYQATQSYIGWNKLIGMQNPPLRVQVEEAHGIVEKYLDEVGLCLDTKEPPPTNYNWRKHAELTATDLKDQIGSDLCYELLDLADEYGYDIQT